MKTVALPAKERNFPQGEYTIYNFNRLWACLFADVASLAPVTWAATSCLLAACQQNNSCSNRIQKEG